MEEPQSAPGSVEPLEDEGGLELIGQEVAVITGKGTGASGRSATGRPREEGTPRRGLATSSGGGALGSPMWVGGPVENPRTLGPLFSPEQMSRLKEWEREAPLIHGTPMDQRRPEHLPILDAGQETNEDMAVTIKELQKQNKMLMEELGRIKNYVKEERYGTPESQVKPEGQKVPNGTSNKRDNQNETVGDEESVKNEDEDSSEMLDVMLKLMEGMQELQKHILDKGNKENENAEVETQHNGEKNAKEDGDTLKGILHEANVMLKSINGVAKQLDDLKVRAVKVTKISCKGGGLLDSGATHAMRQMGKREDRSRLEKTVVTMADGGKREMYITPGKILVCTEKVDPILPLGGLVEKLGCRVEWQGSCCQLWHPVKGRIAVEMVDGCPEVSRREAEELIEEIEEKVEREWMRSLMENHEEADKEEEIPKMEDYWTMSSDGSAVIRVHKHHRKVRCFPGDAEGCPVPVDKLESVRKTVARKTKGGAYTVHEDDWKSARREDQLFEDGSRWAGRTIFKVEGVEPEQRLEEGDQELPAGEEPLPEGDWDFELEDVGGELREAGDDPAPEEGQELEDEGPEGLEVETHWMALPMPTKSIPSVMEAVQEMYLALRADGYPVARMHTDKGREFQNHTLKKWCGNRDIWKTSTAGDNFKANGRVEVTIQKIKSRMRRVLHAAELDGEWWPCAAQYVQAKDKMIRSREEGTIPAFGQEVLFKRRKWKVKDDMEVTHQKGYYLAPVSNIPHGHAVMKENGDVQVTSYVLKKWDVPPAVQGQWQLEERKPGPEGDPHEVRTRIWGKSRPPGREDAGELVRVRNIQQIIKEEMQNVEREEPDAIGAVMKGLEALDQKVRSDGDEELGGEQRQVLQTRIVSLKEVEERKEEWKEPMLKEMMALAEEKEAVTRLSAKEAHELLEVDREVQVLPGKVVCTVKPGGKKKCRIVVCGNFGESHQEGQCLYASGTDVIGLRVAIKEAARRRWKGGTVDVRCAFLNAPLEAESGGSELIADMGTKALAGPKLKDLKKKAGMMAEPQTKVNRINEVKLDMVEIEKYKQALAVIACCLQVQGTSAMEDEKAGKEEDEALIRFGIMVAVFTVIAMKIVEKCGIGKFVYYRRRRGIRKIADYRKCRGIGRVVPWGTSIGKFVYYRRRDPEPEPEDDEIPVEPSVFYTDRGEKYHLRENCYGLRLATRVRESLPCPRCMTPDFRRLLGSTVGGLYIGRNGHYHSVMMCAGREGIEYNEYDTCRYCLNGDVVVD
ncbi:unnamed protein product [Effrenium voratum]|nr:unnamed protein product [Effrenium voratum]